MSHRDVTCFEIEGVITEISTCEAAERARSLKPVSSWADMLGRRVTALLPEAIMVFEDAYAEFVGGYEGAYLTVEKMTTKLPKSRPHKDKRSYWTRQREALGGTIVSITPTREGASFALSNGEVVTLGDELETPSLRDVGYLPERLP